MDGPHELINYIIGQQNPFLILDVDTDAGDKDIRTAYKRLVKEIHPDRIQDNILKDRAKDAFVKVGKAYDDLRDPLKRKDFERILLNMSASGLDSKRFRSRSKPKAEPEPKAEPTPQAKAPPPPPKTKAPPKAQAPKTDAKTEAQKKQEEKERLKREQAEDLFKEAGKLLKKNDIEGAISNYQECIRIDNTIAKYHSNLGVAMQQRGWGGYAQAEFKVALHYDPTDKLALKHYQPTPRTNNSGNSLGAKLLKIFKSEDSSSNRIGDILISKGYLNKTQLKDALKRQNEEKMLLGEILIQRKYIKPEQLAQALIQQGELANQDKK